MRGMRIIKPKGRVFAPMTNANLPWTNGSKVNIVFAALQELASFGANAHAIIPGIGSINGLDAQNYLDNTGTTPATNAGLGAELCAFSSLMSQGTGWVFSGGVLSKNADDATLYDIGTPVVAGKTYQVTLTKVNHTVGDPSIYVGGTPYSGVILNSAADGEYTFRLAAGANGTITINGTIARLDITSISVKEVIQDSLIERINDAAQGLGAELITNGDFSAGTTGWTGSGAGGWLIAGGVATHTAGTSGELWGALNTLADGKTYVVEFDLTVSAGGLAIQFGGPGGTSVIVIGAGHQKIHGVAAGVATVNAIRFQTTSGTLTIDNISVKEVIGIHATQATPANAPVLRKGAVNLLIWSEDFTHANWNKLASSTITGTKQLNLAAVANSRVETVATSSVGMTWTAQAKLSGSGQCMLAIFDGGGSYPTTRTDTITLTATPTRYTVTRTHSDAAATSVGYRILNVSSTAATVVVDEPMMELSTEANPYAPTTTAPASNGIGNSYLEFDGVNDYLSLSAVPFQMSDDHCVVACARNDSNTGERKIFNSTNVATAVGLIQLGYTSGILTADWRDDAGTLVRANSAVAETVSSILVASGIKQGNVKRLRKNGLQVATNSTVLGTTTLTGSSLGAGANLAAYLQGNIYCTIVIKGTATDAQLLTLEKFAGLFGGVTI